MDLQSRDGVEKAVGKRRSADVEASLRPMNEYQVGDSTVPEHLLQAPGKVGGFAPDHLGAEIRGVVQVSLDVLGAVAGELHSGRLDAECQQLSVERAR